MQEVGARPVTLSLGNPQKRSASKPEAGPGESFQSGEPTPPWLCKPNFEQRLEEPTRSAGSTMSAGQKVALFSAGLAAGVGALGLASAQPTPGQPQVQVQLSSREADRAKNDFQFLQQMAQQQGGSLKSEASTLLERVFHHQPEVGAAEAVAALSQGTTIYFYPNADSQGIPIRSAEELKQVTSEVRQQETERNFRQGLENIKEGLKNLGQEIQGVFP